MESHKLSAEHETILKKQLLNLAIQNEVDLFFSNSNKLHDTLFLKFVYNKILEFPFLSTRAEAKDKCKELLLTLPSLLKHSQKATKRDQNNKATRQFVSKCFDLALRTEQEREDDKLEQELDLNDRLGDRDYVVNSGAQLSSAGQDLLDNYDYHTIFGILRDKETIDSLPPVMRQFNSALVRTLSIWMDEELQDPNMLKKLKTIQYLTPTLAIRAILAIGNPVRLMQSVLSLLLARPFGSWNLMQKLFAVMVEINKTERLLKSSLKTLETQFTAIGLSAGSRKKVISKVKNYVKHNHVSFQDHEDGEEVFDAYEPTSVLNPSPGSETIATLLASSEQPHIDSQLQQCIVESSETVCILNEYLLLVERHKEKTDFIELLGNEQMLTILHELLPVIYTPIAKLFTRAHVGVHFQTLFKTLKRIIKVTTNNPDGGPKRYVPVLARFTNDLYSFLHESAANDDGSVENTIKWLESLVAFAREEIISLDSILSKLDESTFSSLLQELDNIKAFYDYRAKLKEREYEDEQEEGEEEEDPEEKPTKSNQQINSENKNNTNNTDIQEVPRPNLTIIPLLVDDFIDLVRPKLTFGAAPTTTSTLSTTPETLHNNKQETLDNKQETLASTSTSVGLPHE